MDFKKNYKKPKNPQNPKIYFPFPYKKAIIILQQKNSLQNNSILISLFCKKIAFVNVVMCYVNLVDTLGNISRIIFFSKLYKKYSFSNWPHYRNIFLLICKLLFPI